MAVSLTKGQKVDLTKGNPGLEKVIVGLGWDTNRYDGSADFDLDASAFLLNANGKVLRDEDFIFYNNLESETKAVIHTGDNRTGEGEGDDESILIDFSKVPVNIERIAIAVTIHDAAERHQNFGQVSNAFIRIVNESNNEEILRYDLAEDFSIETVLVIAELYKHNGEWKFNAVGSGFQGGLAALCKNFGVNV
ncbi:TerD family protein [Sebaldella sp. S0638]|nr:TerD family protein [Sebaldella sp. S0638]MCP1225539.1 TerD family protein [Sebaldella sp. S0638]